MLEIVDKAVIFICLTVVYLLGPMEGLWILPIIISLTLSSANSYIERTDFHILSFVLYSVLCLFFKSFLIFLPLIFYDVITDKKRLIYLLAPIPIIISQPYLSNKTVLETLSFMTLTILLKLRTLRTSKLKKEYINFRDKTSEISMLLEEQNAKLAASQEHEIQAAMLSERNRIAREIHDNLGHILSRCLLQIGAVIAINKDPLIKENLTSIKDTMSEAMDSVRKSVHNLHDESIDLYDQIYKLIKGFSFCPVKFEYDISENLDKNLKYSLIAIVKEALSNIMRHSNATEGSVRLIEHPGFYQVIIQDNGVVENYNPERGIGIRNISDRVAAFNGNININTDRGFKIFISIPREGLS